MKTTAQILIFIKERRKEMKELFGLPCPENQAEYCLMCMDRESEFCPCNTYDELPQEEKFPLDEEELENYIFKQQERK